MTAPIAAHTTTLVSMATGIDTPAFCIISPNA